MMAGDALLAELFHGHGDGALGGLFFKFDGSGVGVVGADEAITVAPFAEHHVGFAFEDGVNAAKLPTNFPGDFKEERGDRGIGNWDNWDDCGRHTYGHVRLRNA